MPICSSCQYYEVFYPAANGQPGRGLCGYPASKLPLSVAGYALRERVRVFAAVAGDTEGCPTHSAVYALYLDDVRPLPVWCKSDPTEWVLAQSYAEALDIIGTRGMPIFISFDHDLGDRLPTGFDFAKFLIESALDGTLCFPKDFEYVVHSANPVGAANIKGLLDRYFELHK